MKRSNLRSCALGAMLLPLAVAAQQQASPAQPFASMLDPAGITVTHDGDVAVISDAPDTGTTLLRYGPDGKMLAQYPSGGDKYAHSRVAWIHTPVFEGVVVMSPKGLVRFLEQDTSQSPPQLRPILFELDIGSDTFEFSPNVDLDGAPLPIVLAGGRFDDIAASPINTRYRGSGFLVDVFLTGITAQTADGKGGTPFLAHVAMDLDAKTYRTEVLVTSQTSVGSDPSHRLGIGIWTPTPKQGSSPEPLVAAAMPTRTSRAQPGDADALVAMGATWMAEDESATPPKVLMDTNQQPFLLSCGGMSSEAPQGALFAVCAVPTCDSTGGPWAVRITAEGKVACAVLPATTAPETYVDIGVSQTAYVTDQQGGAVLQIPGAVPAPTTSSAPDRTRLSAGSAGEFVEVGALAR